MKDQRIINLLNYYYSLIFIGQQKRVMDMARLVA